MAYRITNNELYHYGVKGMKWGVRKETRYSKGKQLHKERADIWKKKEKELNQKSGVKELYDKAYKIADKYGLDADDGGGGNTNKYSEATLRKAGKQYMDIWDQIETIKDRNEHLGKKYANERIVKKYGDSALSDIDYYRKRKGQKNLAITLGVIGGIVYLGTRA